MTHENTLDQFNNKRIKYLIGSIFLDLIGMFTYLIPVFGEIGDVIFAPFYGLAIFVMYRKRVFSASVGGTVGLIEELLPGTDIIPTATLMWIYTFIIRKDRALDLFIREKNKEKRALKKLVD